jgi:hypothetical protein
LSSSLAVVLAETATLKRTRRARNLEREEDDGPLDPETTITLSWVAIALGALLFFYLPPSYVSAGPLSIGEPGGDCHGVVTHAFTITVCKK